MSGLQPSRVRWSDLVGLGLHGLRAHPMRASLSALGIAIGIAAMIAVIGISTSSEALVKEKLAALGTNMLTVSAGQALFGGESSLPADGVERIRRIEGVHKVGSLAVLKDTNVYRNALVDEGITSGLSTAATDQHLLAATGAQLRHGSSLNTATGAFPTTVLGATAAERLGIRTIGSQILIGGENFTVAGILKNVPLAPELDTMALIDAGTATRLFAFDGSPTTIYERSADESVAQVRTLLPPTVKPEAPHEVSVSRPSDALAAQNTVNQAFTGILVGVGSIALLVGGIGVANTMVITVLERRREIGLRRSLGATRGHIRKQFLVEAVLLAAYGGIVGTLLGWIITWIIATANGWPVSIPPAILAASIAITVAVGALAGVLPAVRASRTAPTEALAS